MRDRIEDLIAVYRRRFIAFPVAILLLIFHASMAYAKNGAPSVTVCDLLGSPIRYDKKIVEVHAELILGMHGGALIDERCNSDLGAIRLIIAKELYKNKKVAELKGTWLIKSVGVHAARSADGDAPEGGLGLIGHVPFLELIAKGRICYRAEILTYYKGGYKGELSFAAFQKAAVGSDYLIAGDVGVNGSPQCGMGMNLHSADGEIFYPIISSMLDPGAKSWIALKGVALTKSFSSPLRDGSKLCHADLGSPDIDNVCDTFGSIVHWDAVSQELASLSKSGAAKSVKVP